VFSPHHYFNSTHFLIYNLIKNHYIYSKVLVCARLSASLNIYFSSTAPKPKNIIFTNYI